jgi:hypothetical protein
MNAVKIFWLIGLWLINLAVLADEAIPITVYRSPSCSCCGGWIKHLEQNGFEVKDMPTDAMEAIKQQHGVSKDMASCHTAIVDGYVIEGHVPAADIKELLKTKPKIAGIAVPGMPSGTPGMEMGGRKDPYKVMSFDKDHHYQVFKDHAE